MRILITSGGTREPIDGVRYITNFSSGTTGAFLTDHFRKLGHDVTLMRAKESKLPTLPGVNIEFTAFADLEESLKEVLQKKNFDVVLHLAAISDFSVDKITAGKQTYRPGEAGKISSEAGTVTLTLKRNHKLILRLREYSTKKDFVLVGFKLTNTADLEQRRLAIEKISKNKEIDFIVHNDLNEIGSDGTHLTTIYKHGVPQTFAKNKQELALALEGLFENRRNS